MSTIHHATTTLFILTALQWLSGVSLILAGIQIIQGKFRKKLGPIAIWIVTPMAMLVSTTSYKQQHWLDLLKQQLTQTWSWEMNGHIHYLALDVYNQTYNHGIDTNPVVSHGRESQRNTSTLKAEVDAKTGESYHSLYLFDFPQKGYTAMVEIRGISAPKIHLERQEVFELRRDISDLR